MRGEVRNAVHDAGGWAAAVLLLAIVGNAADAADAVATDDPATAATPASDAVSFSRDVRPLLARRCYACHGPDEAAGSLDLTSFETATGLTDSEAAAIVPGDADASELIERITSHEEGYAMPDGEERLSGDEVQLLRDWIDQGGKYDRHWAFVPPQAIKPPAAGEGWAVNPIDRFIAAGLEEANLQPSDRADRQTLVRRVYQDLIGLPPSPEQLQRALADDRADAYERLVDELLASPQYGERWARHWLDVVRFAETNSFERDGEKKNAYTYRDYVIQSLNADKPFDRFVVEQIAGDELADASRETIAATGFLRLGLWDDEPADPELHRFDQYDDLVRTISEGFLGLTVGCARCHDHKIDPIPQRDYYELVALVRDVPPFAERHQTERYNQVDVSPPDVQRRRRSLTESRRRLRTQLREIEQVGIAKMPGPMQRKSEGDDRGEVLQLLPDYLDDEQLGDYRRIETQLGDVASEIDRLPPSQFVLGVSETDPAPPETHILERGSPQSPSESVEPAFLDILGGGIARPDDVRSDKAGRRHALADWVASNPGGMTARVQVNRIWQHHFGRGLVASANNFGQLGTPPSHPELLDWLATEFVRGGWSQKALHRLIVSSATYRQSGRFDPVAAGIDPQCELLWRYPIRRMDAEEVRDAILAISGTLNTASIGGPSVYPEIEEEVRAGLSKPDEGWPTSPEPLRSRRSLYVFSKRSLPLPLFTAFDFPETDATCEGRFQTVQPGQALSLLNSRFLQNQSQVIADSLLVRYPETATDRDPVAAGAPAIRSLLARVWCREPDAASVARFVGLWDTLSKDPEIDRRQGLTLVVLAVLNTSEFLYVD